LKGLGVNRLNTHDWKAFEAEIDQEGVVVLPGLLSPAECEKYTLLGGEHRCFERRLSLGSVNLGIGELLYFAQVMPLDLSGLRTDLYRRLVPTANRWEEAMNSGTRYPADLNDFLLACHKAGQRQPQSAISRLNSGGFTALRQCASGEHVFPLQACVLLSDPDIDFAGGELVLTEQRPRMQTRPVVPRLRRGDAAIFATNRRPHRGSRGFYRTNLKHAVSEVRSGMRVAMDLLFHDAP
jgi:hypothetical protein